MTRSNKIKGCVFILLLFSIFLMGGNYSYADSSEGLISEYNFDNNFNDRLAGSSLIVIPQKQKESDVLYNEQISFGRDDTGEYMSWHTTAPRGGGFYIDTDSILDEDHSIGMRFSFEKTAQNMRGPEYRKIIDYENRATDNGFYFYQGKLKFFPLNITGNRLFYPNKTLDLVVVREKDSTFNVYSVVDGVVQRELHAEGTGNRTLPAIVNKKSRLGFFFDDEKSVGPEASPGGKIYNLKIWNRALKPDEIGKVLNKKPTAPTFELVHPGENKIIGTTSPNVDVVIKNQAGIEFHGKSDSTGKFSISVTTLKEADTITAYAVNKDGLQSPTSKLVVQYSMTLEAEAAVITLADLSAEKLSVNTLKNMFQTKAVNKLENKTIEDSHTSLYSEKVSFDKGQLKTIEEAKKARPYPLDITYSDNNKKIKKRTWLHVIEKKQDYARNSGLVFYGENCELPAFEQKTITSDFLIKKFAGKVYQLGDLGEALTPLTESHPLVISDNEVKKLRDATIPGTYSVQIFYEDGTHAVNFSRAVTFLKNKLIFEIERNTRTLNLVNIDLSEEDLTNLQTLDITYRKSIRIKKEELPNKWKKFETRQGMTYVLNGNNSMNTIIDFLKTIEFELQREEDEPGTVSIHLSEQEIVPWNHPDGTIHYYKFVPKDINWYLAYNAAKKETYKGLTGYLMTITSDEENQFVADSLSIYPGWLGGTRQVKKTGEKLLDSGEISTIYQDYNTNKEEWYWATGPEKGCVFSVGKKGVQNMPGEYSNWSSGEPNNKTDHYVPPQGSNDPKDTPEDSLQWGKYGSVTWNDLTALFHGNGTWIKGYYVEFSEYDDQVLDVNDNSSEVITYTADIPQRIIFKAKDQQANDLKEGDQMIDKELRIGKKYTIIPKDILGFQFSHADKSPLEGAIGKQVVRGDLIYNREIQETELIVHFIDEDNQEVVSPLRLHFSMNTVINMQENDEIKAQLEKLQKESYSIEERPENETNLSLTTAKQEVTYKLKGGIYFKEFPQVFTFKNGVVLKKEQRLPLNESVPVSMVIKDNRSEQVRGKYQLRAKLSSPFANKNQEEIVSSFELRGNINTMITDKLGTVLYESQLSSSNRDNEIMLSNGNEQTLELLVSEVRTSGKYSGSVLWEIVTGL